MSSLTREKRIYRVTIAGGIVNVILLAFKFAAGILGHSAAMIADAVHSFSDLATDIVVLLFVKISALPADEDHDYGHGKYETLATTIIGLALFAVGVGILWHGVEKIMFVARGGVIPSPGVIAFVAAILSIVLKELIYRVTKKVAVEEQSPALEANAWHHRSDALSSVGTALGIGGAVLLGSRWAILDPIAAVLVSAFIILAAIKLIKDSASELLEKSLPAEIEQQIADIVYSEEGVSDLHNLRTRRIGNRIAIEMHIRMPGELSLSRVHQCSSDIEARLRETFGPHTHIMIHIEPLK